MHLMSNDVIIVNRPTTVTTTTTATFPGNLPGNICGVVPTTLEERRRPLFTTGRRP